MFLLQGEAAFPMEEEADTEMEGVQENIHVPEPEANEASLEEDQEEPPRAFRSRRRS